MRGPKKSSLLRFGQSCKIIDVPHRHFKKSKPKKKSASLNNVAKDFDFMQLYELGNDRINHLESELLRNQRFQQMVIHDMRSPTVAIKSGLQNTQQVVSEIKHILGQDQSDFLEQCKKLHTQVTQKAAAVDSANAALKKAQTAIDDIKTRASALKNIIRRPKRRSRQNHPNMNEPVDPNGAENFDEDCIDEKRKKPDPNQIPNGAALRYEINQKRLDSMRVQESKL